MDRLQYLRSEIINIPLSKTQLNQSRRDAKASIVQKKNIYLISLLCIFMNSRFKCV